MMVLVSYDIGNTQQREGARRLRMIARACQDYGQRVQFSVFEIELDPARWTYLKDRLLSIADLDVDSLRFYFLGRNWHGRVEHFGAKAVLDLDGPLIF